MEKTMCRYVIARYVPHPLREEGVNIGVIIQAPQSNYVACRFLDTFAKVKAVDPAADLKLLREFANAWQEALKPGRLFPPPEVQGLLGQFSPLQPEFLDFLAREYEGRFKFTSPRATMTSNPDLELEDLYREFVAPVRVLGPKPIASVSMKQRPGR